MNNTRRTGIILGLVLLCGVAGIVGWRILAARKTGVTLSPGSLQKEGAEVVLPVLIDTGSRSVSAASIHLVFDGVPWKDVRVVRGDFFPNPMMLQNEAAASGARATIGSMEAKRGRGTILVVRFTKPSGGVARGARLTVSFAADTAVAAPGINTSVLESEVLQTKKIFSIVDR